MSETFVTTLTETMDSSGITAAGFDYQFTISGISRIGFHNNGNIIVKNKFLQLIDGARGKIKDLITMVGPAGNLISVVGSSLSIIIQISMSSTESSHITMGENEFLISAEQQSDVEIVSSTIQGLKGAILFTEQSNVFFISCNFSSLESSTNSELMTVDFSNLTISSSQFQNMENKYRPIMMAISSIIQISTTKFNKIIGQILSAESSTVSFTSSTFENISLGNDLTLYIDGLIVDSRGSDVTIKS